MAFNDAIAGTARGAILIPNGTYKISNLVTLNKSNVVLRGESEDKTIIYDASMSFTKYLLDGAHGTTGDISGLRSANSSLASRVKSVDAAGSRVELERRLPWDARMEWTPSLGTCEPTVTQSGMENFSIKSPPTPWKGEFTELGYNGIQMNGVVNCWVSHITLINAKGGLFTGGGAALGH